MTILLGILVSAMASFATYGAISLVNDLIETHQMKKEVKQLQKIVDDLMEKKYND